MISKKLRAWREKHGLSQAQAAKALAIPVRTLQGWELGRKPGRYALVAIEKAITK